MADDSTPHEPTRYVYGARGAPDPAVELRRELLALMLELETLRLTVTRLLHRVDDLLDELPA